jgi:cell division septation protein DedD
VPPHGPKHPLHHHQAEAARARGTWTVQIGAFRTEAGAAAMVRRLERRQIHAVVRRRHEKSGEDWFLVQIDRLPTHQAAEAAAGSVTGKTHLPTLILHDVPVRPDSKGH